ncbi:MAG: (Fe-S)-binding protein [Patescibacteria group bacterium]|nr:(Fe-S)-binding protein [Patescibacteria group bacterium]
MAIKLPGLNCGLCGFRTCSEFQQIILKDDKEAKRCIHLGRVNRGEVKIDDDLSGPDADKLEDSLGREFDFILEPFRDEEGGTLEFIHPLNNDAIKNLKLKKGDVIIGRPLAAGCPVTHCGRIIDIDSSGIIKWSVIGPLVARNKPLVDIGSYAPVVFEGVVKQAKSELKVGMRYNFMPRHCMLQWRHSGLISFVSKAPNGSYKVRIEGIMLG